MEIKRIATTRKFQNWPSFDLVYEWEDIFFESLDISPYFINKYTSNRYIKRIPFIKYLLTDRKSVV